MTIILTKHTFFSQRAEEHYNTIAPRRHGLIANGERTEIGNGKRFSQIILGLTLPTLPARELSRAIPPRQVTSLPITSAATHTSSPDKRPDGLSVFPARAQPSPRSRTPRSSVTTSSRPASKHRYF